MPSLFHRILKPFPRLVRFLRGLYTRTFLRLNRDKRYDRYRMSKALKELKHLVAERGMSGGLFTNGGEYYLQAQEGLFLFYNFSQNEFSFGDGQSLDFRAATLPSKGFQVITALLSPSAQYIDVGANNGYSYALRVAKRIPACTVFAFEPNPRILFHLKKNVSFNQLENIQVIQEALSDTVGEADFAFELGAGSYLTTSTGSKLNTIKVPTNTLDNFVKSNGLKVVDFVKVDIEGGEYRFFKGADAVIKEFAPFILFELRESLLQRSNTDASAVYEFLSQRGYSCYKISRTPDVLAVPDARSKALSALDVETLRLIEYDIRQ